MRKSTEKRLTWLLSLAKNRAIRRYGSVERAEVETTTAARKVLDAIDDLPLDMWVNALSPSLESAIETFADAVDEEKLRN